MASAGLASSDDASYSRADRLCRRVSIQRGNRIASLRLQRRRRACSLYCFSGQGNVLGVLPAYTIDGYLPCTGVKEGWFNGEDFYSWLANELLPHCTLFPGPRTVIVLDNVKNHCNPRIQELIRSRGCEVRYLPPYSPDYNPIELTFSVLKTWVRRYFQEIWPHFDGNFGAFLRFAVARSRCDQFPKQHFRHAGQYALEEDIRTL